MKGSFFLAFIIYFSLVYRAESGREVLCGACKAIIDELDYAIKHTDQKKTIDIGGRETRAVKYAGSETHLIELMENICDEMNNYALSEDGGGRKSYVRFNSRAGESVTLNNVKIDSSTMKELKDACSTVISAYDDDILDLYISKTRDKKKQLCSSLSGYCTGSRSEL
ncbi:PREDICTED: protein canopy homolog 2-like [Amphimedon queenslandica]|uniref:Saposin B-type domain-containing protein n=1 Tax=Amphimedon queenslandica TaxID=400682 RepID=A0A1X7V8V4_AMPQE|nr:PREDICTED: protein canopy homolog 2-like [Amphimedon queenslandica]|eukprot:XP_019850143.1 PREDICTED: protein canopy homolog 2-like [Amphimedon queenslandica]